MDLSERIKALPENLRRLVKINGCTGFVEGSHTSCCDMHDFDYSIGLNRKAADKELERCVWRVYEQEYEMDKAHSSRWLWRAAIFFKYKIWRILAVCMFIAVRLFGWYFWEKGRWNRDGHPTGDKWWVIGRIKMKFFPKYK